MAKSADAGVWGKMNLKDQREIVVLNAPATFAPELKRLDDVKVVKSIGAARSIAFSLAFVTTQAEVDALAPALASKSDGDAIVWFAYPKGSSKRYTCEFNRDTGWRVMGEAGVEPVRMVAIDEDWSAVRFRRAAFIKTLNRGAEHALSAEGRAKANASKRPIRSTKSASKKR